MWVLETGIPRAPMKGKKAKSMVAMMESRTAAKLAALTG
jgi:hypothetical protein